MKAFIGLFSLLLIAGCSYTSPDAGHERVLTAKPFIFGHGGVDPEPVRTGASFIAWSTDAVDVNMQPVRYTVNFKDFMSSDGVPIEVDTALILKVTDSVEMISKFGPDWYANNIESEFGNNIRQQVRLYGMNEMAIQTTAVGNVQTKVQASLEGYIKQRNMPLVVIAVIIGKVLPPDAVKFQRIETATQEQRKQTEMQKQLAEDARKGAETSRASADNAYRNALGLSAEQFVQLESIHMQHDVCMREHCTFFVGTTPVGVVVK